jgi:hypothetical protein
MTSLLKSASILPTLNATEPKTVMAAVGVCWASLIPSGLAFRC